MVTKRTFLNLTIPQWYVKYEEAEIHRLVAILKTNSCGGGTCRIQ